MIKTNYISQITGIDCAMCGTISKVSNTEYNSETFELISDGTFRIEKYENNLYLWFHCNFCTNDYKIPFDLIDHTKHE